MNRAATQQPSLPPTPPLGQQRPPVNLRSVLLGLFGVIAINAITPFNNNVLANADLIRSYLPVSLLLFLMVFVILINAPLYRFAPRYAYSSAELAVAIGMILVGCALPGSGLMRYLPGHLTGVSYYAAQNPDYADLLRKIDLPDWIFPTAATTDIAKRGTDPVVTQYVGRALTDTDTFAAHFSAVPWHAWLRPAIGWSVFLVGLFGSILCMMVILRRQWVENERLQFPLVTVYLSLIEPPAPGKLLNPLFRNRLFWIGFAIVGGINLFNGLSVYFPRNIPPIPLSFDINKIATEEPWRYCEWTFFSQRIYFTIIGLTMFMQTRTAFSLWFTYALLQVAHMAAGLRQTEISEPMQFDQLFGAEVVFCAMLLYIARHHLLAVLRQMFGPGRPDDPRGRYLPYRLAGWGFICCQLVLIAWLMTVGTTLIGALVISLMLMMLYLVLARIVADTGMIYPVFPVPLSHPFDIAANAVPSLPHTTPGSHFFSRFFYGVLSHDTRQTLPPFAQHALVTADHAAYSHSADWRKGIRFIGVLVLALVLAYIVSGASMLYVEYTYAATLDRSNRSPLNEWSSYTMARQIVMDPSVRYTTTGIEAVPHNRLLHIGVGAAITAALGTLRLTFANWPLHPVGFLFCYTFGIEVTWFSIFLGWLAKTILLNFGGARMFTRAQPFFLGVVYGDVIAAAFWLVTNLALWLMGFEYRSIT